MTGSNQHQHDMAVEEIQRVSNMDAQEAEFRNRQRTAVRNALKELIRTSLDDSTFDPGELALWKAAVALGLIKQ